MGKQFNMRVIKVETVQWDVRQEYEHAARDAKEAIWSFQADYTIRNETGDYDALDIYISYTLFTPERMIAAVIKTKSIFHISKMTDEGVHVDIVSYLIETSISHTRAIFCERTMGTALEGVVIQYMDSQQLRTFVAEKGKANLN